MLIVLPAHVASPALQGSGAHPRSESSSAGMCANEALSRNPPVHVERILRIDAGRGHHRCLPINGLPTIRYGE